MQLGLLMPYTVVRRIIQKGTAGGQKTGGLLDMKTASLVVHNHQSWVIYLCL